MNVLLSTFAVGVLSALVPFINLEAYLVGVAVLVGTHGVWTLPMAAAAGQVVGKLVWYEAGRSSMRVGMVRRKLASPLLTGRTLRFAALLHGVSLLKPLFGR